MLEGKLAFDTIDLGRLRWQSAKFIRYMIRARAKVDPGFMSAADYERWELAGLSREDWGIDRLLGMALQLILAINDKYLERDGSGGMQIDAKDPLQKFKELIGFFADYQTALPEAIRDAIVGRPIGWPRLARWENLPAIRSELDKLPRLDEQLQATPNGPDPHKAIIRWNGKSVTVLPQVRKLAAYLWHSQCVSKQELLDHFWPDRASDGVLPTALSRLNEALSAAEVPWTYHLRGEFVLKETYRS